MSEPTLKLPRGAEALLRDFPLPEPDFEAQAEAIEARVRGDAPAAGLSLDELLSAPRLEAEPGEPAPPSSVRAASPPKSHFAEMARRSVQKKDDHDAAQLARELLAAAAQSRRPSAEMVERVRAAGRAGAAATATPLPVGEGTQRSSGVVAKAGPAPQPPAGNRGAIAGIVGAALALAAGALLFVQSERSRSPTSAALAAEKASELAAAAPRQARSEAAPATAGNPEPSEAVLSPEALAAAPAREDVKAAAKPASGAAPALPAASKLAAVPGGAPAKSEAVVLEDDPAPVAPAPELKPELPPEPQLRPAQGSSGDVPLTPSAGAVSAALSSVRGGAQSCLAGQTDPVTAVVTFAADGHVLRVSAGGPAGSCIQAALSKARIQPFARESFSATTTVRPP